MCALVIVICRVLKSVRLLYFEVISYKRTINLNYQFKPCVHSVAHDNINVGNTPCHCNKIDWNRIQAAEFKYPGTVKGCSRTSSQLRNNDIRN
jgi:hypothetical protein